MSKTKKLTIKYWNSLEESSRKRALIHLFPTMPACVDMLLDEEPKPRDNAWWELVFKKVRQPIPSDYDKSRGYMHYKTVVNGFYLC